MLETAVIYGKKLWADTVLTSVYIKNGQPYLALMDLTPYEAFYGLCKGIRPCIAW